MAGFPKMCCFPTHTPRNALACQVSKNTHLCGRISGLRPGTPGVPLQAKRDASSYEHARLSVIKQAGKQQALAPTKRPLFQKSRLWPPMSPPSHSVVPEKSPTVCEQARVSLAVIIPNLPSDLPWMQIQVMTKLC